MKLSSALTTTSLVVAGMFIASPVHAISFTFSLPSGSVTQNGNTFNSTETGIVTGDIVLPGTSGTNVAATSVIITSAPGALGSVVGIDLVGIGFNNIANRFTYTLTNILNADFAPSSTTPIFFGGRFLQLRLQSNDASFPVNYFGAANSPTVQGSLSGITSPFVVTDRANVTYSTTATAVPFEFSPNLGIAVLGAGYGLKSLRKRFKKSKLEQAITEK